MNYLTYINPKQGMYIILFLFFLFFRSVNAQHTGPDSIRIKEINAINDSGIYYWKKLDYVKAQLKYSEVIKQAQNAGLKAQEASGYNGIGLVYYSKGEYIPSLENYTKAIETIRQTTDTLKMARILLNTAITYKRQGLYDKAMPLLVEGLKYFEALQNLQGISSCLNTIANIQNDIGQYNEALKFHFRVLKIREGQKDTPTIASTLNNISLVYRNLDSLEKAMQFAKSSLSIKINLKKDENIAQTISNIGTIYIKLGKQKEAEKMFLESYNIRKGINDQNGIITVSNELGNLYLNNGKIKEARNFIEEGYSLAKKNQSLELGMDNAKLRVQLYEKQGELEKALAAYAEYDEIKGKVLGSENTKAVNELKIRYETEKNELEIASLNRINKSNRATIKAKTRMQYAFGFGGLMFLILSVIAYKSYKRKLADNKKIETLMSERQHRTKNNLQLIAGLLGIQSDQASNQTVKNVFRSGENRMQAVALLDRLLHENNDNTDIDLKTYIQKLSENLEMIYRNVGNPVRFILTIAPVKLEASKATPLGLIINELITNSFKYAFADILQPEVTLYLSKEDNVVSLKYADNGVGFNPEEQRNGSMGLKLIQSLSEQLRGEHKLYSDNGFRFLLSFRTK